MTLNDGTTIPDGLVSSGWIVKSGTFRTDFNDTVATKATPVAPPSGQSVDSGYWARLGTTDEYSGSATVWQWTTVGGSGSNYSSPGGEWTPATPDNGVPQNFSEFLRTAWGSVSNLAQSTSTSYAANSKTMNTVFWILAIILGVVGWKLLRKKGGL
jgi:hypothetical protein